MGGCNFANILIMNVPKSHRRIFHAFLIKKNFQIRLNYTIWNPVSTLWSRRILSQLWTLSFKKGTITTKTASQLKCFEERKRLNFTWPMKELVWHSVVWTLDTISVAILEINLAWCWEELDLTNQNLLMTLSACTLLRYKRTWLSAILLGTWRPRCGVALHSFQNSKLEALQLLDSTWTIRHLANCNSDHCSKNFFIVFTFSWETREVTKYPLYLSVSFVLFWCLEKPPTFISNLKDVTRWLFQVKWRCHPIVALVDIVGAVSVHLLKLMGELPMQSFVKMSPSWKMIGLWFVAICSARNCGFC